MTRRLAQLAIGLWLFGISLAMVIRSGLGNAPWDVLHQGLANHLLITDVSFQHGQHDANPILRRDHRGMTHDGSGTSAGRCISN